MNNDENVRIAIIAIAICVLGISGLLFYLEKNVGGGAFATVFIVCLIFAYLSRFKKFKGFGVEAELWE